MGDIRYFVPSRLPPNGHYSHAVIHGNVLSVSGQLGRGPAMPDDVAGDITVQARRCLQNLVDILDAAGSAISALLKVNVCISDIAHWPVVDAEHRRLLGEHRQARAMVPTGVALHHGALIEIDGIAAVPNGTSTSGRR